MLFEKKSKLFAEQIPNLFKNISCCSKDIATRKTTKKNEIQRMSLYVSTLRIGKKEPIELRGGMRKNR